MIQSVSFLQSCEGLADMPGWVLPSAGTQQAFRQAESGTVVQSVVTGLLRNITISVRTTSV
jgi:hypothetical protein